MKFNRNLKTAVIFSMTLILSKVPQLAVAEAAHTLTMMPTSSLVTELTEVEAQANISSFLSRADVQQQLMNSGLTKEEVSLRLATLSKSELNRLSSQMTEARAGGDLLVAIILVLLILILLKRI